MELKVKTFVTVITTLALTHATAALTCLKCEEQNCRDVNSLQCKGGTTLDPCGCCQVCAKVEGESCGGPWNIAGVCDKGLVCSPKSDLQPGRCRNPRRTRVKSKYPKCIQRYRKTRHQGCLRIRTVFCNKCCERCCENPTTCNPNPFRYLPKTRCYRQQRLYGPRRLAFGDEVDGNENEIEALHDEIKG